MSAMEAVLKKCDDIRDQLRRQSRYNRNTMLLVMVLWGVGLPLTLLGSLLYAASR